MKYLIAAAFFCLTFSLYSISAQTPETVPEAGNDVVVINTRLIQIDAVVTDENGKQVSDLKPQDFEIFQNGQKQNITNFSYVSVIPSSAAVGSISAAKDSKLLPPVPVKLKPGQVRRTIALVVDDLGLSPTSMVNVRKGLKKFVDEQMLPGDLVAIIRTGVGIGALQQFTSDKTQLYAAIERLRFNLQSRTGISEFAPLGQNSVAQGSSGNGENEDSNVNTNGEAEISQMRDNIFTVGTLGALQYIVNGVGELPGRKAVFLFSDGFTLNTDNGMGGIEINERITNPLRRLVDDANRAGVVINCIDARGVVYTGITAADSFANVPLRSVGRVVEQTMSRRSNLLFDTQGGSAYLADKTGGRFIKNNNDIAVAVSKVLESEKGYYLIGYQPDEETFDPAKRGYNQLTIKIKRPGLNVKYRNGFFGVSDEEIKNRTAKVSETPQAKLFEALSSPFGSSGVNLRLNALFTNDVTNGSLIQSVLHVDAKDLKFTDEPNGIKKAVFDVAAYTFGENGVPVDSINKNFVLSVENDSATYRRILEKGFVYYLNLPVKSPGAYQLRIALRDAQSEQIGAANQFIEVPDLKKGRLIISGLILENMPFASYQKLAQEQANPAAVNKSEEGSDPQRDTALRRFRRNTILQYTGTIFNSKLNLAKQPQITTRVRLIRDGKVIFEDKPAPVDLNGQSDLQRLSFGGAIFLPQNLELDDYVLQIIATDTLAKEKRQVAAQWIDFEIVN